MPATSSQSPQMLKLPALLVRALLLVAHLTIFLLVFLSYPLHRTYIRRLAAWWDRRLLRLLGLRISIIGTPAQEATLTVANHVSWLDILLLGGYMQAAFVSKAEVRGWPLIGRFAELLGTVFLPRGQFKTADATRLVGETLATGQPVVLFPSATTIAALLPPRFHARMFAAAIEGGYAIQPVAIHYLPEQGKLNEHHPWATWTGNQDIAPHFLRLCRLRGLQVNLYVCPQIDSGGMDRRQLAQASHAAITTTLMRSVESG